MKSLISMRHVIVLLLVVAALSLFPLAADASANSNTGLIGCWRYSGPKHVPDGNWWQLCLCDRDFGAEATSSEGSIWGRDRRWQRAGDSLLRISDEVCQLVALAAGEMRLAGCEHEGVWVTDRANEFCKSQQ